MGAFPTGDALDRSWDTIDPMMMAIAVVALEAFLRRHRAVDVERIAEIDVVWWWYPSGDLVVATLSCWRGYDGVPLVD